MQFEDGVLLLKEACEMALREDRLGTMMQTMIAAAQEGEVDAAVKTADAILRISPRCADAAIIAGVLLADNGIQRSRVLGYFQQALSWEPDNGLVSWWLAVHAMGTGKTLEALALLANAVRNEPRDPYVVLTLIWLLELSGRTQELPSVVSMLLQANQADSAWLALMQSVLSQRRIPFHPLFARPLARSLRCLLEVIGLQHGPRTARPRSSPLPPLHPRHHASPTIDAYRARYGRAIVDRYADAFTRVVLGQEGQTAQRQSEPTRPFEAGHTIEVPPDMVLVQAGTYTVGYGTNVSAHPERKLPLPAFLLDRYPVTNRQWQEFQPGHAFPRGQEDHPVVNVDFVQATLYAHWKGKRLPTEIEWEAAARGLDGRRYPWGNNPDPRKANCAEQSPKSTTPVTRHPQGAAPCGARDMMGNVQEWVDTNGPVRNGQTGTRVTKGGGFGLRSAALTCWHRGFYQPLLKSPSLGFRCAKDVPRDAVSR